MMLLVAQVHRLVAGRRSWRPATVAPATALAVAVGVLTLAAAFGATALALRNGDVDRELWNLLPATVPFGVVGAVIIARRPRNPVGWLFAVTGFGFTLQQFLGHYAYQGLIVAPGSLPFLDAAVWTSTWLPAPALVAAFVLMPLYFPDGRLPSPRWRWVARFAILFFAATAVVVGFLPGDEHIPVGSGSGITNPWASEAIVPLTGLVDLTGPVWLALTALGLASLAARFRRSDVATRQQIKWLVWAFGIVVVLFAANLGLAWLDPISTAAPVLIPLAAAVAILRHRLYDVDVVINRTLVYLVLSGFVVGIYVGVVATLGAVVPAGDNLTVSLVATGLVAALFAPLRARLQQLVNGLLYGHRDDPYRVLALLGERLEAAVAPDAVLPAVVRTVAEALKLPYVAVEVGGTTAAEHGTDPGAALLVLPLVHAEDAIGELRLAPRRPREAFSAADHRLLNDLARQVAAAVHAEQLADRTRQLSADLQASRHRLVDAREEERRRLGRELHDGVGPQLASVSMTAEAARELIATEPERAEQLLAGLLEQAQTTVEDLRRMSHGLRPPALDALGLLGALRTHASTVARIGVQVDAPDTLPPLPAAVEIAAYRIASEALHNVVRHAGATRCILTVRSESDTLHVEVADDGRGFRPGAGNGMGLSSMRERAAELGGRLTVEARPLGGTLVRAVLPCVVPAQEV